MRCVEENRLCQGVDPLVHRLCPVFYFGLDFGKAGQDHVAMIGSHKILLKSVGIPSQRTSTTATWERHVVAGSSPVWMRPVGNPWYMPVRCRYRAY